MSALTHAGQSAPAAAAAGNEAARGWPTWSGSPGASTARSSSPAW